MVKEKVCVPHAVLVFLDEFLLVVLIFHPVLAWDDKIGCYSTLWARPAKKRKNKWCKDSLTLQSVKVLFKISKRSVV